MRKLDTGSKINDQYIQPTNLKANMSLSIIETYGVQISSYRTQTILHDLLVGNHNHRFGSGDSNFIKKIFIRRIRLVVCTQFSQFRFLHLPIQMLFEENGET